MSTKRKAIFQDNNMSDSDDDNNNDGNMKNTVELLLRNMETLTLQLNNNKKQLDDLNTKYDNLSENTNTNSKKKTGPKAPGGSAYNHFIKNQMDINKKNGYFESKNIKGRDKMKYCASLWKAHKEELLKNS